MKTGSPEALAVSGFVPGIRYNPLEIRKRV